MFNVQQRNTALGEEISCAGIVADLARWKRGSGITWSRTIPIL
jgi:hypothetical protein